MPPKVLLPKKKSKPSEVLASGSRPWLAQVHQPRMVLEVSRPIDNTPNIALIKKSTSQAPFGSLAHGDRLIAKTPTRTRGEKSSQKGHTSQFISPGTLRHYVQTPRTTSREDISHGEQVTYRKSQQNMHVTPTANLRRLRISEEEEEHLLNDYFSNEEDIDSSDDTPINISKKRVRGGTKGLKLRPPLGTRWKVEFNETGQPIGENGRKLGIRLGLIARMGNYFPIDKFWKQQSKQSKIDAWHDIELEYEFDDPDACKYCMDSIKEKLRQWRGKQKKKNYLHFKTEEERLANRDDMIDKDQWVRMLKIWDSEEKMEESKRNEKNRQCRKTSHALGTKSLARFTEEQRKEHGADFPQVKIYIKAHQKKNGDFTNDNTAKKMRDIEQLAIQTKTHNSTDATVVSSLATQVFGSEHGGYMRGMGIGVTKRQLEDPSENYKRKKKRQLIVENIELHENNTKLHSEVSDLRAAVSGLEERFSQLIASSGSRPVGTQDGDAEVG